MSALPTAIPATAPAPSEPAAGAAVTVTIGDVVELDGAGVVEVDGAVVVATWLLPLVLEAICSWALSPSSGAEGGTNEGKSPVCQAIVTGFS